MTDPERIAIIGPGRLGTLLAVACARAHKRVVAIGGGNPAARVELARTVAGARPHDVVATAASGADLVLLCVPDDALETIATDLAVADAVGPAHRVVHVAGARGCAPLERIALTGARVAACHPAMTVPLGARDPDLLVGIAWAVTAAAADRGWAEEFVVSLGGEAQLVREDGRALYHAGLAVGSNAVGAAVATARRLLLGAGITRPETFLRPLIDVSVSNVLTAGADALTGPIVRADVGTVRAHLTAIDRDVPELALVYRSLARAILSPVRGTLPPEAVAEFDQLLHDGEV